MCSIKSLQTVPGRLVLAIFYRFDHEFAGQHGKVNLQGIRRNIDPVVQHAVRFGDDAIAKRPSITVKEPSMTVKD